MTRTCSDCATPITRHSRSGRCKPCSLAYMAADPVWQERRRAALAERIKDPEYRRSLAAGASRAHRKKWATDPEYRERRRAEGRRLKATGLGNAAQPKGSPGRKAVGQKLSDQRLPWCPREYRPFYQKMRRIRGKTAEEAKRLTLEKIEADKPTLTPFERQLEAVRNGAGIVEIRPIPSRQYPYTLAGVSGEIMV